MSPMTFSTAVVSVLLLRVIMFIMFVITSLVIRPFVRAHRYLIDKFKLKDNLLSPNEE